MTNLIPRQKNYFIDIINVFIVLAVFLALNIACNSSNNALVQKELESGTIVMAEQKATSSVNFIIDADAEFESMVFSKFGGIDSDYFIPFRKNFEFPLSRMEADFYQLYLIKKGDLEDPTFWSTKGNIVGGTFWLQGDDITVKAIIDTTKFRIDTVINSPFYYYVEDFYENMDSLTDRSRGEDEVNNFLLSEFEKNIDNAFSLDLASSFTRINYNDPEKLRELQKLLLTQDEWLISHQLSSLNELEKMIDVTSFELKSYEFNDEAGERVEIKTEAGSIYLLDFWFTGCEPCFADHKTIASKWHASFVDSGIKFIGVSTDKDQSRWKSHIKNKKYPWDNYIEVYKNIESLSNHVGIYAYPTYLVINGNGEILNRTNSLDESIAYLKSSQILK